MEKRFAFRGLITFVILTFSSHFGCSAWRPMPTTNLTPDEATSLEGKRVRFYTDDGVQTMSVNKVDFPYVHGLKKQRLRHHTASRTHEDVQIRVDLRKVHRIEFLDFSTARTTLFLAAFPVVIWALIFLAFYLDEVKP